MKELFCVILSLFMLASKSYCDNIDLRPPTIVNCEFLDTLNCSSILLCEPDSLLTTVSFGNLDDGYLGPIDLGFTFDFGTQSYEQFFLNTNGSISFGIGNQSFLVDSFLLSSDIPILSPFFSDVDISSNGSGSINWTFINNFNNSGYPGMVITWDSVTNFDTDSTDLLNTFQLIIVPSESQALPNENNVMFIYDELNWVTGNLNATAIVGANYGLGLGWQFVEEGVFSVVGPEIDNLSNSCFSFSTKCIDTTMLLINNAYCVDENSFLLSGTPEGGMFKINGLTTTEFNPSQLGVGDFEVSYLYTDSISLCQDSATANVSILAPPIARIINFPDFFCFTDQPINIEVEPPGGELMIDNTPVETTFDPSDFSPELHTISYTYSNSACTDSYELVFEIYGQDFPFISNLPEEVCRNENSIQLNAFPPGGEFIIQSYLTSGGIFSPSLIPDSNSVSIEYLYTNLNTGCVSSFSESVEVSDILDVTIALDPSSQGTFNYCANDNNLYSIIGNPAGGTFSSSLPILTTSGLNTFVNPDLIDEGVVTISYSLNDICQSANTLNIEIVQPTSNVSIVGLSDSICGNANSIELIGNPSGGEFSGEGVVNGFFVPSLVTTSSFSEINYSYIDNNGCEIFTVEEVFINDISTPTISNLPNIICANDSSFQVIGMPENGIFSGNGDYINSTGQFYPNLVTPNTSVEIVYSFIDANNCEGTTIQSIFVSENPSLEIDIALSVTGNNDVYCANDNSNYLLSGIPSGGDFSGSGVNVIGSDFYFNPSFINQNTTIPITYTYSNSQGCLTFDILQVQVFVSENPTINNLPSTICTNSSTFTLVGTPPNGIFSIDGQDLQNNLLDPSLYSPGNKTITYAAADGNGCEVVTQANIIIIAEPNINFALQDFTYCENDDPVELAVVPNGGVFQQTDGLIDNVFYPALVSSGEYEIIYVYNNGLCSSSESIMLEILETPSVEILNDEFEYCFSDSVVNLNVSLPGGIFDGDGIVGNQLFTSAVGIGPQLISYELENPNGCVSIDRKVLEILPSPVANFTTIYDCEPNTLSFRDLSFGIGDLSYDWTFENFDQTTASNPVYQFSESGVNSASLKVTDQNGCFAKIDTMIIVPPQNITSINVNDTIMIVGDTLIASGVSTSEIINYTWLFEPDQLEGDSQSIHIFNRADIYDIQLQTVDIYGCPGIAFKKIFVQNNLDIDFEVLNLFPNPTSGDIKIELYLPESMVLEVLVLDVLGRVVQKNKFGSIQIPLNIGVREISLTLSDLVHGTYFISFFNGSSAISGPLNFEYGELSSEKLRFQNYLKILYQNGY